MKTLVSVLVPLVLGCAGETSSRDVGSDAGASPVAATASRHETPDVPDVPALAFIGDASDAGETHDDASTADPCVAPPDGWTLDACGISGAPTTWTALASCPFRGPGCVTTGDALCCPSAPN